MKNLTIAIPTYNRRERLIMQLDSILSQKLSKDVNIIILDNHSDYNVGQALGQVWDGEKLKNVQVITNRSNLGLALNISLPFYYCKTKWLWILSDDDRTTPDSLETIRSDMSEYAGYACLKYSLRDMSQHDNRTITTLDEIVSYYSRKDKNQGEFIFISNNLFNMEIIEPYIGRIVSYSYNAIAGILPYVYILDEQAGKIVMREREVVEYIPPQKGKEWNYVDVTSRLITLVDYPFKSDGKLIRRLMNLMNHFSFFSYMEGLIKLNDKEKVRMQISKTFSLLFQNGGIRRTLYKTVYYSYMWLNIDGVAFRKRLKELKGKNQGHIFHDI